MVAVPSKCPHMFTMKKASCLAQAQETTAIAVVAATTKVIFCFLSGSICMEYVYLCQAGTVYQCNKMHSWSSALTLSVIYLWNYKPQNTVHFRIN